MPEGVIRSLLPEGEALPRDDAVLRWEGPAGARFDLTVATEDLRVLATASRLEASEYRIPPDVLSEIPSGGKIAWGVKAVGEAGAALGAATFLTEVR